MNNEINITLTNDELSAIVWLIYGEKKEYFLGTSTKVNFAELALKLSKSTLARYE